MVDDKLKGLEPGLKQALKEFIVNEDPSDMNALLRGIFLKLVKYIDETISEPDLSGMATVESVLTMKDSFDAEIHSIKNQLTTILYKITDIENLHAGLLKHGIEHRDK